MNYKVHSIKSYVLLLYLDLLSEYLLPIFLTMCRNIGLYFNIPYLGFIAHYYTFVSTEWLNKYQSIIMQTIQSFYCTIQINNDVSKFSIGFF